MAQSIVRDLPQPFHILRAQPEDLLPERAGGGSGYRIERQDVQSGDLPPVERSSQSTATVNRNSIRPDLPCHMSNPQPSEGDGRDEDHREHGRTPEGVRDRALEHRVSRPPHGCRR